MESLCVNELTLSKPLFLIGQSCGNPLSELGSVQIILFIGIHSCSISLVEKICAVQSNKIYIFLYTAKPCFNKRELILVFIL